MQLIRCADGRLMPLLDVPGHCVQVLFGLPKDEAVITGAACTLAHVAAPGRLYVTSGYLCFSTLSSPLAPPRRSAPAISIAQPLSHVVSMSKDYVGRSRALAFTLRDRSQLVFAEFGAAAAAGDAAATEGHVGGRDDVEEAIRLHVMGTNTLLDRQLRGIAAATAPAALGLPPGEQIARSYDCALHSTVRQNRRGVLYVCRAMLLFVGGTARASVRLADIERVELARVTWLGGRSVVVTSRAPPHKIEVCLLLVPASVS
jgi:GRAM domain